jgi:NAD(P)-dependent dehydrogenase (short-subunit alcohol dehydrogenase family)
MKVENRTFIVSGGYVFVYSDLGVGSDVVDRSSGLGAATVQDLLAQNAYVSILDRSPPPEELKNSSRVKYFEVDIREVDQINRAVEGTVDWTKGTNAPLGGVVNCAGVAVAAKIIDSHNEPHPLDLWDFAIAVNLTGTFNLTRLALKHLIKVAPEEGPDGERGIIIFVASAAAVRNFPHIYA